jgi:hypothetical protein
MKFLVPISISALLIADLFAQDPGMEPIGSLGVELFYATNDDVKLAGDQAQEVAKDQVKALKAIKELSFNHYRRLGGDRPTILRGYESWATPLKPSKEILVSFQPIKREGPGKMQMVLEYWQSKRKVFSTNPVLTKGKSLYLLGPEWRKGRLILAVKVLNLKD